MKSSLHNITKTEYIIIRSLLSGPKEYWNLLYESFDSAANTIQTLKKLLDEEVIYYKNNLFYINEDKVNGLNIKPYVDVKCSVCNGTGINYNPLFSQEILKKYKEVLESRPTPIPEFDQGVVSFTTLLNRITFMYMKGDLENKDIVLIGDDDLASVGIALTNLAKKVLVLEADKRLVDYINKISKELNLNNLESQVYNVESKVDSNLLNKFDVFLTDPVETINGITLFISRGASMLKENGVLYFGLTHLEASNKKWYKIHTNLYKMNFVITDILDKFQVYEISPDDIISKGYRVSTEIKIDLNKPQKPWYNSAFHRLELIDKPNPIFDPNQEYKLERDLYYDDEAYVTLY